MCLYKKTYVDNSISLSSMTELVVDNVVVEPLTVKLPVTVRLPPIVGLSTIPTVTVPELSATVVSFAVAAKVNVPPKDTALVLEPSETVIDELLNLELPILPASLDAAIEPANIAFVT